MKPQEMLKKEFIPNKGHIYDVDGLGVLGYVFGLASLGFILYSIFQVIFY
jgi:hypothetical protein